MDKEDKELGRLFEALSIDRQVSEPMTPPFQGYGPRPEYWNYHGGPYPATRPGKPTNKSDITYLNKEEKRHRIYGPAYISQKYNIEEWWKDGVRHREDGPAYIHNNNMVWFLNGVLHRLDGPAVLELGGPKQYWIHGKRMSEKEYKKEIARMRRKGLIK
jgi:hypothetical protein